MEIIDGFEQLDQDALDLAFREWTLYRVQQVGEIPDEQRRTNPMRIGTMLRTGQHDSYRWQYSKIRNTLKETTFTMVDAERTRRLQSRPSCFRPNGDVEQLHDVLMIEAF